jgi:hypothetical protein
MSFVYWEEMGAMWLVVEVAYVQKEDCVLISSSSSCVGGQWPSSTLYVSGGLWFFIFFVLCSFLLK